MTKPMRNWVGVCVLAWGVGVCSSAIAQTATKAGPATSVGSGDVTVGPSVPNVEEAEAVPWPFRPCETNDDCRDWQFCFSRSECGDPGFCVRRPQACPDVWDPVCGCDGVTYGNKCEAAAAGVNVDHEGECPAVCGGIQGIPCTNPGDFCRFEEGECCCDFQGVCTPTPDVCPEYYDPVCGCDGVTYSNECFANAAGQSVDHQGECAVACTSNADCLTVAPAPGTYCEKGVGDCDGVGECTPVPQVCTAIWDPVCGCDGVTYGNACAAAAASVSVAYEGECEEACGGVLPVQCSDPGDFCKLNEGECCCDFQGVCTPIPDVCPLIWDPVCGCDGVTYGNECLADAAGMSVDHQGPCAVPCCDPADEPGVGGRPPCIEGASCCADGTWACNNGDGTPSCDSGTGPVCEDPCCDPADEPGVGGNPPCFEGASCCADGTWACNNGNGTPSCDSGTVCNEPEICGGLLGIPCSDPDDFCKLNEGECCCDFLGVCTPVPDLCLLIWDPVCGCDGVTYGNECQADAAEMSVDHQGACDDVCQTNADCAFSGSIPGEFCQKAIGDCNGSGSCSPTPQACLDVYIPVCGCNGQTYSNACYAHRAGVNVASDGACAIDQ